MLKTVSSITNAIGALNFKGTWNASTNTPTLASGVGTKGDYYVVGTAGTTNLNGISNWGVGDWATFNGSVWQRVEGGADLNGVNLSISGKAGIGETSPTWKLSVKDATAQPQATFYGYSTIGAKLSDDCGTVQIGNTAAYNLTIDFNSQGNTQATIQNTYYTVSGLALMKFVSGSHAFTYGTAGADAMRIGSAGDMTVVAGNLVIGTAGKGIDFSADPSAPGMTSELLDDYEEGTWTPAQGAGLTVIGAFSSAGRYTKIGRLVTVSGFVQGGTSVAVSAGNALTSNLPFTTGANGVGVMIANDQSLGGQLVAATTDIYTTGMVAVVAIFFTVTYSV
jgi:hypothetical protein